MDHLLDCDEVARDARSLGASRRQFLTGLLGLGMPAWQRAAAAAPRRRAKACILLYQFGGPSHIDGLDPKPDAPAEIRGEFQSIATAAPGIRLSEHLPRLAQRANDLALVRSLHHDITNHNPAAYYNLSGHSPNTNQLLFPDSPEFYPGYGSLVSYFRPARDGIPTFVALPCTIGDGPPCPGQNGGFLGKAYYPLLIQQDPSSPTFLVPELSLPDDVPPDRLAARHQLLNRLDRHDWLTGLEAFRRRAFDMLVSPAVQRAFNIAQEPAKVRDRYGRTAYGQSCLLARRLVEAGVSFVNVYFAPRIGIGMGQHGWDTHRYNFQDLKNRLLPQTDQTVSALLEDLAERGLLADTLVVWQGEFGRKPKVGDQTPDGRGHWPNCYSALLAGGGIRGGTVHGASDPQGAYPATDPVQPDDIAATMLQVLDIPLETEITDLQGRPQPVTRGKPLASLLGPG